MNCTDCRAEGADCLTADRVRVCSDCLYERVVKERDEARAEVKRLRFFEDCRGNGLTYECNLTRPCVTCRLRTVAERQREACADVVRELLDEQECDCPPEWPRCELHRAALRLRATPLVTEGDK